jgi:ribosomal protein L11 methyltransferase
MSNKSNYIQFEFPQGSGIEQEFLIAALSDWPFEGFEERAESLIAYIPESSCDMDLRDFLKELKHQNNWQDINEEIISPVNWNEEWEKDYETVTVDDFCYIRANFHPASSDFKHEIVITPKMSFGTGHHATTYMMIKSMQNINFEDKSVFDFGCGTSILAILGVKLGALRTDAVDNDNWAFENSIENALLNDVSGKISFYSGELEAVPMNNYDIILANINRHVILENIDTLAERLNDKGLLLCSGFLTTDKELITENAKLNNLHFKSCLEKDQWSCVLFEKND